jgi:hypothetical protein
MRTSGSARESVFKSNRHSLGCSKLNFKRRRYDGPQGTPHTLMSVVLNNTRNRWCGCVPLCDRWFGRYRKVLGGAGCVARRQPATAATTAERACRHLVRRRPAAAAAAERSRRHLVRRRPVAAAKQRRCSARAAEHAATPQPRSFARVCAAAERAAERAAVARGATRRGEAGGGGGARPATGGEARSALAARGSERRGVGGLLGGSRRGEVRCRGGARKSRAVGGERGRGRLMAGLCSCAARKTARCSRAHSHGRAREIVGGPPPPRDARVAWSPCYLFYGVRSGHINRLNPPSSIKPVVILAYSVQ